MTAPEYEVHLEYQDAAKRTATTNDQRIANHLYNYYGSVIAFLYPDRHPVFLTLECDGEVLKHHMFR